MRSTTQYTSDFGSLSLNTSMANQALGLTLVNDALRYLTGKFYFNERTYTTPTVAQQQYYPLPPQVKNLIDVTVTIGAVVWVPNFAGNRKYWDSLNVITFYQDFPSFYFTYNNQLGIFPIPASAGNTITMNYKLRLRDLSQPDYITGTVSVTNNTPTLVFSGSTLVSDMVNRWVRITAPAGDEQWYQIEAVNVGTSTITLYNNYTGNTVSSGTFTIGEMPILAEDYQDLPLYRALYIYFNSIVPNPQKATMYKALYDAGYEMLNQEYGEKTTSPVLLDTDAPVYNPNLFVSSITQA